MIGLGDIDYCDCRLGGRRWDVRIYSRQFLTENIENVKTSKILGQTINREILKILKCQNLLDFCLSSQNISL